jgi:hypothetical protein
LLLFFSCKKGSDNQENSVPSKKNTVTYTSPFSGTTYTVNETNSKVVSNAITYVDGKIETSAGVSTFNLDVVGSNLPFYTLHSYSAWPCWWKWAYRLVYHSNSIWRYDKN